MFIIEVIPISRGITKETLSYFSAERISPGSLVSVPLRKKTVNALVVSARDARDAKSEIRGSDYEMKKIGEFKSEKFLSESFIKSAIAIADFSVSSVGSVLNFLIPKITLENASDLKPKEAVVRPGDLGYDQITIQSDDEERFANYRSLIREEFARKHSVFFCLPTAPDVKRASELLPKGIEEYTYVFYGSLSKKKILEQWKAVLSEEHPVLIIATGLFFSIDRKDVGTVIVENESSRSYKLSFRPFIDVRVFAEIFAKERKAKFFVGDTLLKTETIFRLKQGELNEFVPAKFRSLSPAENRIIDMRNFRKGPNGKFEVISSELAELIKNSHLASQNLFIFSARRGIAPQTVCGDCGEVVKCNRCHSPISLHKAHSGDGNQNFFFCHACGEKRSAEEKCPICNSWKLRPLGVGIELLEQELSQKFPLIKIFRIDKDKTPTAKAAEKEAAKFYASPGSILLGTEMSLPYLSKKIDNTAIASLDSLFALPDFRIHEKILHLLLRVRSLTVSLLLVQTRLPEEHVLEYALKGNLIDFYREEIAAREMFHYPPFTILIKISLSGTRASVNKEMEKLKNFLLPYETEIFQAFSEDSRGVFTMHALTRLPKGAWVDRTLLKKLLALPPQFRIAVDPESLL